MKNPQINLSLLLAAFVAALILAGCAKIPKNTSYIPGRTSENFETTAPAPRAPTTANKADTLESLTREFSEMTINIVTTPNGTLTDSNLGIMTTPDGTSAPPAPGSGFGSGRIGARDRADTLGVGGGGGSGWSRHSETKGRGGLSPNVAPRAVPGLQGGVAPSFNGDNDLGQAFPASGKQSRLFYSHAEELWIISRPIQVASNVHDDQYPGTGALVTRRNEKEIPLPLKHTDVKANVSGYIATVNVTQQFHNPYDSKIEAVYVFPLPENSAVNEFHMTIGNRQIRGIIREREDAERIYENARAQGYTASLLTQERPNIFTQSVANIEPGKQIDVNIRYYNTLAYADGWFEFVFPMVVGPRFNPPGTPDPVAAVPRGGSNPYYPRTQVEYLKPNERSGHDIALQLDIAAGVNIEEFDSPTHRINTHRPGPDKLSATLSSSDRIPNRDFVLRFRVTGDEIKSGVLTHTDHRGGFFTMMLYPPRQTSFLPRYPMEMVFVLDCSGSMSGRPLAQAKDAIRAGLKLLRHGDSFQLINFSMTASQLGSRPLEATPENIRKALNYLDHLNAEGGTMMIEGIKGALDFPHDPRRLRFVSFLTDGYIGNESEILEAIKKKLGPARIFSFGVGSSVNRYLLDSMARVGRGAVAYFLPQTETAPWDPLESTCRHASLSIL